MSLVTRWAARFADDADAAWAELRGAVEAAAGPLQEPSRDQRSVEVGFVWFGSPESSLETTVSLSCQLVGQVPAPMTRLGSAPVWMLSVAVPADATVPYQFVVDDPLHGVDVDGLMAMLVEDPQRYMAAVSEQQARKLADPTNSRRVAPQAALMTGADPAEVPTSRWESVLDLAPGRESTADAPPAGGRWEITMRSALLGNERRLAVRRTSATPGDEQWLLVALDGDLSDGPWGLLDAAHQGTEAGWLPPLTSVAVYNASLAARAEEMVGRDELAGMLAEELPAALAQHGVVFPGPERTILAGISATGLAAAHAAYSRPDVYGNVLSCSGGFIAGDPAQAGQWYGLGADGEPEWLTRRIAVEPVQPVRFWLDVGTLERDPMPQTPGLSILTANRHLGTVLAARGYDATLREFPGGHDLVHWQHTLLEGLRHLTGSATG